MFDIRFVPVINLYDTLCDVVIIADNNLEHGRLKQKLNPSFLRSHMTVLDVTSLSQETGLLGEARYRGCNVVGTREILLDQLRVQFKALAGKELSEQVFNEVWESLPKPERPELEGI